MSVALGGSEGIVNIEPLVYQHELVFISPTDTWFDQFVSLSG
jgi:hypothetical protein